MSILISAPIRTGKTLFAVKCIFDELNKGRQVFTNIVGMNIDGVRLVSSSIDKPFDWRDLPNGSVLVWDEAHEHPAFSDEDLLKDFKIDETYFNEKIDSITSDSSLSITEKKMRVDKIQRLLKQTTAKRKEQIKDIGRGLLLHGHFGIEIYFLTQRVTKLNTDVLASVTTHYVMRRKFGMQASMIWEFGEAMTSWSKTTASIALRKWFWRYPKHLYKFYVSSENHQVKKTFSYELLIYAILIIALLAFAFSKASGTGFFGLFEKDKKTVQHTQQRVLTDDNYTTEGIVKKNFSSEEVMKLSGIEAPASVVSPSSAPVVQLQEVKQAAYDVSDPYDYSYEQQQVPVTTRIFSGCMKNANGKYVAYDQQGSVIHSDKDLCKKLMIENERPFNPYSKSNSNSNSNENLSSGIENAY